MGKRKTLLTVILGIVLAAIVAAAAVLGAALSRSAFSDEAEAGAGEARWRVAAGEAVTADGSAAGMRPYEGTYSEYLDENSGGGARVRHSLVPVGAVENLGDVKASVSVSAGEITPVVTGEAYDINEYTGEEITEHFECTLYWSYSAALTSYEDEGVEEFSDGGAALDPKDADTGQSAMYVYMDVAWTSDLQIDVSEEGYDGAAGDMFDSWASRHLECFAFTMTIEAVQAE